MVKLNDHAFFIINDSSDLLYRQPDRYGDLF